MKITKCRVNHLSNPLGYQMETTVFSYVVEEAKGKKQKAARIIVTADETGKVKLADTGMKAEVNSLGEIIMLELRPRTRYYWTVTVQSEAGEEACSEVNWFETGKIAEPWSGRWITCNSDEERHPVFYKRFVLECERNNNQIKDARLYISGLGLYQAFLNGEKVGQECLTPYCNDYNSWVQYQTYNVTKQLQQMNEISVLLGNGWYKGRFTCTSKPGDKGFYSDIWKLIAELHITYEDDSCQIITTDDTWNVRRSNITFSNIYDGEHKDDTLATIPEEPALYLESQEQDRLNLVERLSIPVLAKEEIEPIELLVTPTGERVFDLGQNIAGGFRMKVHEPKGTKIRIQMGEILQKGNFYRDNLRTAKAEYCYISDGKEHIIEPVFTYYGYRYAKVEGIKELKKNDFIGIAYYSDNMSVGRIETGDKLLNKLLSNISWGQKCNFIDVPTDCPQRDERFGWTGDTQVFVPTASYLTDSFAFYRKYLYDLRMEQTAYQGMVPIIVPSYGNADTSSVWGDAAAIIPWDLYLYYGDVQILKESLDSMIAWVDYIGRIDGDNHGWRSAFHYGDWLALDHPSGDMQKTNGGTEKAYIADIYYMNSVQIVSKSAKVLADQEGKEEYLAIAQKFEALFERLKKEIQAEYFSATGRCVITTQTGYVLALYYNLTLDRKRTLTDLLTLLKFKNNKIHTGFVGTPLISNVLSSMGQDKLAYEILHNEEFPGWLYTVNLGATTIWERWNSMEADGTVSSSSMNSFNHYAYGSIGEWMWQVMVGIKPVEDKPGFKHIILRPVPDYDTKEIQAEYLSPAGAYRVHWKILGIDEVSLKVEIPFDCTARLELPDAGDIDKIQELVAGIYEFTYKTEKPLKEILSVDTPIGILLNNTKAYSMLMETMPQITRIPDKMKQVTLRKALEGSQDDNIKRKIEEIDSALKML